jgi:TATA-box binding protein (TBP) (component of TFIID and TFIIIB)
MKTICISILLLGLTLKGFAQNSKDEAAIKAVVEKETQSFIDRDAAAIISCHAYKPYSLMLVAESGNVHYTPANPNEDVEKSTKEFMTMLGKPNGDTFKDFNYVIRINGTSAFAYYDQTVKATNGVETNFHEVRYLEKMGEAWKVVYVGAVGYKP